MTEEAELEGGEAPEGPEPVNPAAVSIALGQRSSPGAAAVDAEAAAFLRDQRRLINLQTEHLHEQRELQLAHLRVRRWKDRMSLSLQGLAVLAGAVIAVGFAAMPPIGMSKVPTVFLGSESSVLMSARSRSEFSINSEIAVGRAVQGLSWCSHAAA